MERSNPVKSEDDQKILLLHTVSRKVIEMTRELPGLDVLDFNLSKSTRKVTLSIGYKEAKPVQKLDLSEVLGFQSIDPNKLTTTQDFQPNKECEIHHQECPFSKLQDKEHLDTEKTKYRVPLSDRPEFNAEFHSPGLDMMQKEIVRILTDYHQKDSDTRRNESNEEDSRTPTWFNTFVNTNVEQMDEAYFQSLLAQRAADPNNPVIQRRIDNFLAETSKDNAEMTDDEYREFVPGERWLSREERKQKDLDETLTGLQTAISKHKKNAWEIVFDVLHQALKYEYEGNILTAKHILTKEIKQAIKEDDKKEPRRMKNRRQQTQERRNRDILKPKFATSDQIDEDCNEIMDEAFRKIERKVQEKKQVHFHQEEDDNNTEALRIGSYGQSMFRN